MESAITKEINKEYIEAVKCYENEIDNSTAPLESYINLSFLYWCFAFEHFEINIPNNIPEEWSIIGGNRYMKVLELGLDNYSNSIELNFWKRYYSHIIYSEEFSERDCELLLEKYGDIESNTPYFFLYLFNKEKYEKQRNQLINECERKPTAKNLYIKSIIGS